MNGRTQAEGGHGCAPDTILVRVVPRSSREEVAGFSEGTVRIRLTAPPVENRANEALVRFLSQALGVPRRKVEVVAGDRGRSKVVRVHGMSRPEIFRRLGLWPAFLTGLLLRRRIRACLLRCARSGSST